MSFLLACIEKQGIEDELFRLWCKFLKALTTATNELMGMLQIRLNYPSQFFSSNSKTTERKRAIVDSGR
ncbi:hypothetical protein L3Y34_010983 [Caenorhabditis briggsae]|uniref:Uncharacterized protein n=1 Tax=Caenorhabditis briggsae TaxID=6238 RepID=A0AAE8ZNV2_CAEBR|nr:hypothetical protein L3Y34_010983 [Caenorhabditis briggsae]